MRDRNNGLHLSAPVILREARRLGVETSTWSPGDGYLRYRLRPPARTGGRRSSGVALEWTPAYKAPQAWSWLRGYAAAAQR